MSRRPYHIRLLVSLCFLLFGQLGGSFVFAQDHSGAEGRTDVLRLNVFFRRGISTIDPDFRDNGAHMRDFKDIIDARMREGCTVDAVLLRGSAQMSSTLPCATTSPPWIPAPGPISTR